MAAETLEPRLVEGWAEPGRAYDDGHRLIGHRIYIAGMGSAVVRGFNKGKFGASAHTVELDKIGGIRHGTVLECVSVAFGRAHPELDSRMKLQIQPGEEMEVKEVRRMECGTVRVRVIVGSSSTRKKAKTVWVSPVASDGTVCFVDRDKKKKKKKAPRPQSDLEPEPEQEPEAEREAGKDAEPRAEQEADLEPESEAEQEADLGPELEAEQEADLEPELEAEQEAEPEPEGEQDADLEPEPAAEQEAEPEPEVEQEAEQEGELEPEPEPKTDAQSGTQPHFAYGVGPTRQVKLRRKGNAETPWLIWPRGKLPDVTSPTRLKRTVTIPWEEEAELLQAQGWRLPTEKESLMNSDLVNYNIYVSGYGAGRVLDFIPSSFGPSEHKVLFDDERFKTVRVKLRRKGNQETPWMVMPGLLHRRPGAGNTSVVDVDDDDDWWECDEDQTQEEDVPVISVEQKQLSVVPIEEGLETSAGDSSTTPSTPVTPLPDLCQRDFERFVRLQGAMRGKILRLRLNKSQRKRRNIAQELLMTEDTYVKGLRGLVTAYLQPLRALAGTEAEVLTSSQIRTVFSEIETILLMHDTQLLPQLKQKVNPDNWTDQQTLGDLFGKEFASLLKMYTFYANNYMQALTLYGELARECQPFIEFARQVQEEGAVTRSVESYLITPIQRIPRYVMLLHELKKATLPAHPDKALLSLAVESIEQVADHVNEQKRVAENRAQVAVISRRLISSTMVRKELQLPAGFELVQPDRQCILEGNLVDVRGTWLASGNGELKKRTFFLFNDLLIKGQLADKADAPCAYRGMIQINHMSIVCRGRARKDQKWFPALSLRGAGTDDGDEWVMLAATKEEREKWVAALNRSRNWKHSFAVDYAKKVVLEQAVKDREQTERAKTHKRAARRASLESSVLNPYSMDRFEQFLAQKASTHASSEPPEQLGRGSGRSRSSTDFALADIDDALAATLLRLSSKDEEQPELKVQHEEGQEEDESNEEDSEDEMPAPIGPQEGEEEEEEEDEMSTSTCAPSTIKLHACQPYLLTSAESTPDRLPRRVMHGGGVGVEVHFGPLPARRSPRVPTARQACCGSPTQERRSSLPDMNSPGHSSSPNVASSSLQALSPAFGTPTGFLGRISINTSATLSDLDGSAAGGAQQIDHRRVLGEDSVIEVELTRVDPDDLEGPLGMEGGRAGISGTDSTSSTGWTTPLSGRSSIVRSHCHREAFATALHFPPAAYVARGACPGSNVDCINIVTRATCTARAVPSAAPVQVSRRSFDGLRGTRVVRHFATALLPV